MSDTRTSRPSSSRQASSRPAGESSVSAPSRIEPRLAARGRLRRRTRLIISSVVLAALVLVAFATYALLATSWLGVSSVEVRGAPSTGAGAVRQAAAIRPGSPLARLDVNAVAGRVAALPLVAHVLVTREWPRTVRITLRERVPAGVLAQGPTYVLVDAEGVSLGHVSRRPMGLPLVSAPVDSGPRAVQVALSVLRQLPPGVRAQVRQARAAGPDQIELQLTRGRTVLWGSDERSARKAVVLRVLLTRRARLYDVTAPDAPTTTG